MTTLITEVQLMALFQPLTNWQDRYRQIIQLSKMLPDFPAHLRTTDNQIEGCENRVWLAYQQNQQHIFTFLGDSEGRIVKGLLTILLILANHKTATQIAETDFLANLKQLKIIDELSDSRQLGLTNIIKRIKFIAQTAPAHHG
ncbi:cysteine desulfuration protein SufE [Orbus hercynius]|uniref:Cysteine desulfuration protein SufE n=1 Tax=Orbus hercynius TaxID=593135 RepID=A0A495RAL8_9GAMM|nr:cysteine desulfurase sulfur acceptor subunit CsdE [Orbus hercynius]RKS84537.1 cysteine desulfuration protein SufE [Orbus hercynius]